ncbi:MAG: hypothetical protein E7080_09555 [Bacteroidales bacterium]|nr:hypothetical protein [Bacteroidales bacterium]
MSRRWLLLIMTALIYWSVTSAGEKNQITNLFDGDSLAQLNENQCKILSLTLELLAENDSAVILPQELSIMLGDSAIIKSYPNWIEAYFSQEKKKANLIVPTYAETPSGLVRSRMIVECKKDDEYECVIETKVWESVDKSAFSGVYMESSIEGCFLKGKVYKNGMIVSNIENKVKGKVYNKKINGKSYPWYASAGYEHFSKFGIYKSSYDRPTPITDLERSSGVIPSNLRCFLP